MIITVVDLSLSPRETLPFAPETLTCIERSLASGRHVIIYHNRR
ncbi:MAG TPA: hypothetical protein PK765_01890 [bacterium]|nr:hypothetical protein [bacterium]